MARWLQILDDAGDRIRAEFPGAPERPAFHAMELAAVRVSLANLRTFPWLRERELAGTTKLHGAYFAIADGILHLLDEQSGTFAPVP
jgi:carbonic anhydrase